MVMGHRVSDFESSPPRYVVGKEWGVGNFREDDKQTPSVNQYILLQSFAAGVL